MEPLTAAQQQLYDWIVAFIHSEGHSPTYRQMMRGMGLKSPAPIQSRLEKLIDKGYLEHTFGEARSLRLAQRNANGLLIRGTIAAGGLVEVFPDTEVETLDLGRLLLDPSLFALRVRGDSMIEAMIDHNDVVILRPTNDVKNIKSGTIVAARVEGQTTLKHFHRKGHRVMLKPANANYEPMLLDAKTVEVQGVLVGVMRSL